MTHIREMRLRNWKCFAGEQTVELEPTTYAVVARLDRDSRRSNWLGKSSLLGAPRYAMTGKVSRHDGKLARSWITRGADQGGVDLELSDGTYVSRGFGRTGSEQLLVISPEGVEMRSAAAERWLAERYGSPESWDQTWHLEQDETSRLVLMGSTERAALVSEWAGLERLEGAIEIQQKRVEMMQRECQQLSGDATTPLETREELEQRYAAAKQRHAEAKEAHDVEMQRDRVYQEWVTRKAEAEKLRARKNDIVALEPEVAKLPAVRHDHEAKKRALDVANQALEETRKRTAELKQLSTSGFEGQCPVSRGFACPATVEINQRRKQHGADYKQAATKLESAAEEAQRCADEERSARSIVNTLIASQSRLDALRQFVEESTAHEPARAEAPPVADIQKALGRVVETNTEMTQIAELMRGVDERNKRRRDAVAEFERATEELKVARAALMVFTRAKRSIIKSVLDAVQGRTNDALAGNVDLEVEVSWGREGRDFELSCSECGYHYGKSQAAKRCPECGVERAKQFIPDLRIQPSRQSGGARDLAGLMTQLAASAWRRDARGLEWNVAAIDEPFGGVDRANRAAIAVRLDPILRGEFGVEQAFVVAHDPDTLGALPGRIEIVSDGTHSRIEVK